MAVKYSCDKCGKLFDKAEFLSVIRFEPPENHFLYIHTFAGDDRNIVVEKLSDMLCDKCASELLSQYMGVPVDANRIKNA